MEVLARNVYNELCDKLFTCSCQPKFQSKQLFIVYCFDPSLLRCIVLSFDAFESSAYQLKIVSQDATLSSYCLIADQRYGSVFSANIHVMLLFEGRRNVWKATSYNSYITSLSCIWCQSFNRPGSSGGKSNVSLSNILGILFLLRLSLDIGHPEVWNCFSIDAMIKDKSSGYGCGHGMMYIDEKPGYLEKVATKDGLLFSQCPKSEMWHMKG